MYIFDNTPMRHSTKPNQAVPACNPLQVAEKPSTQARFSKPKAEALTQRRVLSPTTLHDMAVSDLAQTVHRGEATNPDPQARQKLTQATSLPMP